MLRSSIVLNGNLKGKTNLARPLHYYFMLCKYSIEEFKMRLSCESLDCVVSVTMVTWMLIHCSEHFLTITYGYFTLVFASKKWNWIGHTLHKETGAVEKTVLDWNPQGYRRRGRPKRM